MIVSVRVFVILCSSLFALGLYEVLWGIGSTANHWSYKLSLRIKSWARTSTARWVSDFDAMATEIEPPSWENAWYFFSSRQLFWGLIALSAACVCNDPLLSPSVFVGLFSMGIYLGYRSSAKQQALLLTYSTFLVNRFIAHSFELQSNMTALNEAGKELPIGSLRRSVRRTVKRLRAGRPLVYAYKPLLKHRTEILDEFVVYLMASNDNYSVTASQTMLAMDQSASFISKARTQSKRDNQPLVRKVTLFCVLASSAAAGLSFIPAYRACFVGYPIMTEVFIMGFLILALVPVLFSRWMLRLEVPALWM